MGIESNRFDRWNLSAGHGYVDGQVAVKVMLAKKRRVLECDRCDAQSADATKLQLGAGNGEVQAFSQRITMR